jgi:DNA-binding beta-propeller fold protein YncE
VLLVRTGAYLYVPVSNRSNPFRDPGSVLLISTATNEVVTVIPVGVNPAVIAIAPNGKHAYVTDWKAILQGEVTVLEIEN